MQGQTLPFRREEGGCECTPVGVKRVFTPVTVSMGVAATTSEP